MAKQAQTNAQMTNAVNVTNASVAAAIVTQQQQQGAPAAIPQELTTMTDNDLLSFINPSCFDQGIYIQIEHFD